MKAVHFGAGNIGRGFIGVLLHEAGFSLTFLDVNQKVVDQLNANTNFRVIETGLGAVSHLVSNYSALNSQTQQEEAALAIAEADIVTTSVGVSVLKRIAPLLAEGLGRRTSNKPLIVMACENAIGASDLLLREVESISPPNAAKAIFANTAVDRIVPPQRNPDSLDVVVEAFSEWIIDSSKLGLETPTIESAKFVENLEPFIERKLFTVNTGHATLAYAGQRAGLSTIVQAMNDKNVKTLLDGVLAETSRVLVSRHGFDPGQHAKYVAKTMERFSNPDLDDPVVRVGREPRRKLARHDRFIGPAAYLAELGEIPEALLLAVEAALLFTDESDPDVAKLHIQLQELQPQEFVREVMGIEGSHPLAEQLTTHVKTAKMNRNS